MYLLPMAGTLMVVCFGCWTQIGDTASVDLAGVKVDPSADDNWKQ